MEGGADQNVCNATLESRALMGAYVSQSVTDGSGLQLIANERSRLRACFKQATDQVGQLLVGEGKEVVLDSKAYCKLRQGARHMNYHWRGIIFSRDNIGSMSFGYKWT